MQLGTIKAFKVYKRDFNKEAWDLIRIMNAMGMMEAHVINLLQVTEGILKSVWNCSIKDSQKQKVGYLIEGKIKEGT